MLALLTLPAAPAGAFPEPDNETPPKISGTAQAARVLTASTGTWNALPEPDEYSYRWCRVRESSCLDIGGATGSSYALTAEDIGERIRVRVTARNLVGEETAISGPVGPVAPNPPVNTSPPDLQGSAVVGRTLVRTVDGTWTGPGPYSYARQWLRCDATGASCAEIPGATGTSYRLADRDIGSRIRLRVRASGPYGTGEGFSTASGLVRRPSARAPIGPAPSPQDGARRLRRLTPFPRIVVAGFVRRRGARFTRFVVRGPRGARVRVRCRGRGCPWRARSYRMRKRRLRVRALERRFGGGSVITIAVVRAGFIGKYTRLRIRAGRVPARVDRCLDPGARRPRRCGS